MSRILICTLLAALLPLALCAQVKPEDVLLKAEIETFTRTAALTPLQVPGASGGTAMQMNAAGSGAWSGVRLEPGDYTLLFRVWAPAGDQDGFFVEVGAQRWRRVPPGQRRWYTMAYPFRVDKAEDVVLAIVVQELGFVVDQAALVRGTYTNPDDPRIEDLPGESTAGPQISAAEMPRLESPASLAAVPGPGEVMPDAAFTQCFEGEATGASGKTRMVEGGAGRALYLDVPDGRFVVDVSALALAEKGTVEFRVRPREAQQLWWDQGWHFFLHCEPADEKGLALSWSRNPGTQLRLDVTAAGEVVEGCQMSTSNLDGAAWHHMLVSWDLSGERQYLWAMVDGQGQQVEFRRKLEPGAFKRIEIGNSPLAGGLPFLPIDGAIDDVCVSTSSVARRLP